MLTKSSIFALTASLLISTSSYANQTAKDALLRQTNEIEWSLKHSSMAERIDKDVLDKSTSLIGQARLKISAGQLNAAEGLISQASTPLHVMSDSAMNGMHPDARGFLAEQRETLRALIEGTVLIARQKGVDLAFAESAQQAVSQSMVLERAGKMDDAQKIVTAAYVAIQKTVAQLRDGDYVYLAIADLPAERQWSDGLRRFDERRQLTEYLISDASAQGIDADTLHSGLQAAEQAKADGLYWANQKAWDRAVQSLDVAYLKFEDSWRTVGIEW